MTGQNEHFIKNSIDFINKIKGLKLNKTDILVSFDVESLFTRVPVLETCNIIENRLLEKGKPAQEVVNTTNAVRTVLQTTYFQFRGEFYEQAEGAAMGSPLSPTIANIFMEDFENKALDTARLKPSLWIRYVDDTFTVWPHGEEYLPEFIAHLNSITPGIKFTYEIENKGQLPFLDVLVTRNKLGGLSTSVYRKATCSNIYLNAESCNPKSHKESVIRTLVLRAVTHSSNKKALKKELDHLNKVAILNGYSKWDVTRNLRWARKITHKGHNKKVTDKIKAVIPYHPNVGYQISRALSKVGIEVAFKPPRKINSFLPSVKDKVPDAKKPGVYSIPCECELEYVGETKRSIETRIKDHKKHIEKAEWEKSAVAAHYNDSKHKILWDDTKIVAQSENKYELRFKEALAIRSVRNMNQDCGAEIPKIWIETLASTQNRKSWKKIQIPTSQNRISVEDSQTKQTQDLKQDVKGLPVIGLRRSERIKSQQSQASLSQSSFRGSTD